MYAYKQVRRPFLTLAYCEVPENMTGAACKSPNPSRWGYIRIRHNLQVSLIVTNCIKLTVIVTGNTSYYYCGILYDVYLQLSRIARQPNLYCSMVVLIVLTVVVLHQ